VEVLTTERLVLEPWAERHREKWVQLCSEPGMMRYIGRGATWSRAEADAAFDEVLEHWRAHGFGWRSPLDRETGEWLGFASPSPPRVSRRRSACASRWRRWGGGARPCTSMPPLGNGGYSRPSEMAAQQSIPKVAPPGGEHRFGAGCAWIEGRYLPIDEARIPILDVGFSRSDLTYDVIGVWQGRFFRLEDHLDRFERGCAKIRLAPPLSRDEMREILLETVRRSGLRDAYVEAIVTRGVLRPGVRDPRELTPCFYAYAIPYVWIVRPELQEQGTAAIVARETRRIPPDSVDPTVKNFHWGDLVRALYEAYDRDASLPILTDGGGLVAEGPGFNVFVVADGVVRTPSRGVLEGITRKTVIELAQEEGHEVLVGDVSVTDLYEADELFITSTAGGVMPIATLDGEPVGRAAPGPITTRLRQRYWDLHSDPRYTLEVDYPE
jgi:branched-chain amino acid aminotransferase